MCEFIKENRKQILIGCGITFFFLLLSPIIEIIRESIINVFLVVSDRFSNWYVNEIALNDPDRFSKVILIFLLMVLVLLMFYISHYFWQISDKLKSKRLDILKKVQKVKAEININKEKEKFETQEPNTAESNAKLDKLINEIKDDINKPNRVYTMVNYLFIIIGIIGYFNLLLNMSISSQNIEFRNRMIVLKPHIGQDSVYVLESKRAKMKSMEDLNELNRIIEEIEMETLKNNL